MDGRHQESPARITAIKNALIKQGIYPKLTAYEAPLATDIQLQQHYAHGRIVSILEDGYHLKSLADAVSSHIDTLSC